ncbi:hypothetical protein CYMTET_56603 [Cymbomonas tetramitiformis]|uniref:Cation-transporting P-type ATPase C-terminal domain-containing protein n=1 Tax=Cymbomonas tetramitiformis TaxID=36881 RepID=A0AAE0ENL1_9CHLO|nr:hypothetical protein CYMTET_56603 [Cymbomonas tetramitiformis]
MGLGCQATSVKPCIDLVKRGRCTLVTTLQMFKILGLNCLSTAYVLSVQYLDGVKLGDTQATITGMLTALMFLFISHAEPLERLSHQRPYSSIFCPYFILSILLQFTSHIAFLIISVQGAVSFMPEGLTRDPDGDFAPNMVNTISWLVNMQITICTFAVNYYGAPFNTPLTSNYPLLAAVVVGSGLFAAVVSDGIPGLAEYLELVPVPAAFRLQMLGMATVDFLFCFSVERFLRWKFPMKGSSIAHTMQPGKPSRA